jgi:hypothetical protein
MEGSSFDERVFFRAIHDSGARALLIGRRALVLLGLPVLTADYDFWIAMEDIAAFNRVCEPFGLMPTRTPAEAQRTGRYALENDEHVDVLVARSVPTVHGRQVEFEALWIARRSIDMGDGHTSVAIPTIENLILTKQIASRPKDLEDIRLLEALRLEDRP